MLTGIYRERRFLGEEKLNCNLVTEIEAWSLKFNNVPRSGRIHLKKAPLEIDLKLYIMHLSCVVN